VLQKQETFRGFKTREEAEWLLIRATVSPVRHKAMEHMAVRRLGRVMVKAMVPALMEVARAMVVLLLATEDKQIVIASLHRQHTEASPHMTVTDSRLPLRIQLGTVTRLQPTEWGLVLLMGSNRAAVLMVSKGPTGPPRLKTPAAVAMEGGGMTAKAAAVAAAGMAETTAALTARKEAATGDEGEEEEAAAVAMVVTVAEDTVATAAGEDTAVAETVAMVAVTVVVAAVMSAVAGMTAVEEADLLVWEVVTVVATKISVALETTVQGMNHLVAAAETTRTTRTTTPSLFKDCRRMSQLSKLATISNRLVSLR